MRKRDFEMKEGQRFGFRKYLGVGLCAVTLGTFFVTNETTVKADTTSDNDAGAKSELVQEKIDDNTAQQPASTNTNVQNGKDTAPQTSTVTDNANVQETADKDTQSLQVETKAAKASTNTNDDANNTKQNGDKEVNSSSDTSVQKDDESTTLTVNGQKSEANLAGLTESKIKRTREAPEDNQDVQKFTGHQAINDVPDVEDAGYKDFHPDTKNTLVIVPYNITDHTISDLRNRPYIINLTKNADGTYKKIDLNSYFNDIDNTRISEYSSAVPLFYDEQHNLLINSNLYDPNKVQNHILYFDIKADLPEDATTYPMSVVPTGKLEEMVKQDPFIVKQNPSQSEPPQSKTYHLTNIDNLDPVAFLSNTDPFSNMVNHETSWINGTLSNYGTLSKHEISLILKNVDPSLYQKYLDENNITSTDQEDPDSIANAFYPFMMGYSSPAPSDTSGKLQQILNQSVILPEYDDQGKIIPNKYAGIVTFDINNVKPGTYDSLTGKDLFNGSMDIKLTYTPLDKDYKNKLAPFYAYDNNGNAENMGWNYFELKQAEPSKPVQPTAPTQPTSKSQSSQPTPTPQPTDPTQPTIPSQPTTAPQPTQPTQLSTPDQPSNPTPVLPQINPTVPKHTKTSSENNTSHDENTSVRPHGQKTTWNNNAGIHYEHVDSHDSITETKKQTNNQTKFDKENSTLPQTGSDQTSNKASIILGGIAAAIGMLGLIGVKKRKHN